ncbi:Bax inhibitor-1/YccA family membrane protein [Megamonas hypermegale]|nr:Bax inhibitor-1/YccA family protein [Megamonas hypermegale]MDM8143134.1 Bax inhibitor-1/YccA family protein [Megamonas hypermegale]
MEYFCAFGLLLTLVWLYIEILRLIQMILAMFGGDD